MEYTDRKFWNLTWPPTQNFKIYDLYIPHRFTGNLIHQNFMTSSSVCKILGHEPDRITRKFNDVRTSFHVKRSVSRPDFQKNWIWQHLSTLNDWFHLYDRNIGLLSTSGAMTSLLDETSLPWWCWTERIIRQFAFRTSPSKPWYS